VKNAVKACSADGLLATLEEMGEGLELCEKDLAEFLESKRRIFPRFYFVSTNMLLDILSNGNRPWVVAQHINALFQGIKDLALPEGGNSVEKLVSNEGEEVAMKGGALKLQGKVENYLGELINAIRKELLGQMKAAIDDYAKRERKEWLFDHLAQLCIVGTQLFWTSETEAAFDQMQRGEPGALKEYSDKQVAMLGELITLVQGDLDRLQRRKIMNLITMETHSRDINKGMIAEGFDSKDCFTWVGQLKTCFQKRGQDSEEDVWIDICDASFRYSFEYLGNAPRLVITPLTDRIYITATQASHLILGCAPAGPAGTGKTETTKDLSAALGKAVYVFNCGPEMDFLTMAFIFTGLASSG
jgi:dynein heavy chain